MKKINLLSNKYKNRIRIRKIISVIFLINLIYILFMGLKIKNAYTYQMEDYQKKTELTKKIEELNEKINNSADYLNNDKVFKAFEKKTSNMQKYYVSTKFKYSYFMLLLREITTENIKISDLTTDQKSIIIEGQVKNYNELMTFISALEKNNIFYKVSNTSLHKDIESDIIIFKIKCTYQKENEVNDDGNQDNE